jgi:hypothetical protein
MRRLVLVCGASTALAIVAVGTASADPGGVKPANFGDCVSASAARPGDTLTPRTINEVSAPPKSQGQGNADQAPLACTALPPPP